jgi:2,4-dienoyl-CoA reductase-like NADH-dependent reductase (Old Yellow Enzyme family)
MSLLFSPMKIGKVALPNRFVCSATHEGMAKNSGEVSEELVKKIRQRGRSSEY